VTDVGEQTLRERIFARDGYRCAYCAGVFPPEQLSLDHVQPRMRGGDNSEGNLVTACKPCNAKKGHLPAWAFLADLPDERANFLRYATSVWPRHLRAVQEEAARRRR
jgi:5-methylcytosine-specific restriction endonuclease McrA